MVRQSELPHWQSRPRVVNSSCCQLRCPSLKACRDVIAALVTMAKGKDAAFIDLLLRGRLTLPELRLKHHWCEQRRLQLSNCSDMPEAALPCTERSLYSVRQVWLMISEVP